MALDLRESVAGFKLPEEDVDSRQYASRAQSTQEFDSDIIDLEDELLPDDDIYSESRA